MKKKLTKTEKIRRSKEYRLAMIEYKREHKYCELCGEFSRTVHHKNCVRYYPELASDKNNMINLCGRHKNNCHGLYHNTFNGGYRKKATEESLDKFLKIAKHLKDIDEKDNS